MSMTLTAAPPTVFLNLDLEGNDVFLECHWSADPADIKAQVEVLKAHGFRLLTEDEEEPVEIDTGWTRIYAEAV